MKKHLHGFLTRLAEHHVAKAQHHAAMSGHYEKLATLHKAKSDMGDACATFEEMGALHSEMATEHTAMGQEVVECAKALQSAGKAFGMGSGFDELEPLPTGFSRVTPDVPGHASRLISRAGGPPIQKLDVPPEFSKVFSIDPDE